ncbi:5-formyltetrahydrofolate cyclo-ligase [Oceanobacillus limi]|uniref:5-formyltetrahydrofolate cyclo-ligase n=1 Tax=Oceanobacillus limi TaxID=930131 RepID=UPI003139CDB8
MRDLNKKKLRQGMISSLKDLSNEEKRGIEKKLLHNLLHSDLWRDSGTIGVTISQGFEWDTQEIVKLGWKANKQIVVPKCFPTDKKLKFYELTDFDQLEVVYYNLLEPNPQKTTEVNLSNIDLLVVPGLLFDRNGYRIGFGGGYYDRLLSDYAGTTISMVSKIQLMEELPVEAFDIPVQHFVTESGVHHIS